MDTRMMRLWQKMGENKATADPINEDMRLTQARSQSTLATDLSISKMTIHRYHTGERTPTLIDYGRMWGRVWGIHRVDWELWAGSIVRALRLSGGIKTRLDAIPDESAYASASRRAVGEMFVKSGIPDGAILAQYMEVIP
jgi:hypothetical protein